MTQSIIGDVFKATIPQAIADSSKSLPLPIKVALTTALKQNMADTLANLGSAIERQLLEQVDEAGFKKNKDAMETVMAETAAIMGQKFADSILAELKADPSALRDVAGTVAKVTEISDGLRQLTEGDLDNISRKEIQAAIANAKNAEASKASNSRPRAPVAPPAPAPAPSSFASRTSSSSGGFGGKGGCSTPSRAPSRPTPPSPPSHGGK